MARTRAKLNDKEERILVQAQLMGLDTASMVRIGNRLRALDAERKLISEISEYTAGKSWTKTAKGWTVTRQDGKVFNFEKSSRTNRNTWGSYRLQSSWVLIVDKPGTRFKTKTVGVDVTLYDSVPARLCPDKSKDLYLLLKYLHNQYSE